MRDHTSSARRPLHKAPEAPNHAPGTAPDEIHAGSCSALHAAAAAMAGSQQYPAPALYVVATPIGNLADLSLRALYLLRLADAVACEDTRHTGTLLARLGLSRPLMAVHAHNEHAAAERVLQRLAQGQRIVLVSDAGTPAICDPGAALVAAVREGGYRVIPVPGASSALAALSVAGDAASAAAGADFVFVGFLPAKGSERERAIERAMAEPRACVLFEAPHRIQALARALALLAPTRTLTVCRELTKQFEQVHTLPAAQWPAWLEEDADRRRGEFVLVLHRRSPGPGPMEDAVSEEALKTLSVLMEALPLKQAVAIAARLSAVPRNALYEAALRLRG